MLLYHDLPGIRLLDKSGLMTSFHELHVSSISTVSILFRVSQNLETSDVDSPQSDP